MDKKVMLQGLAEGLARRQGLTLAEAELFVRSVFEIVAEYLQTEKQMKIKGLGTFKLVTVESRESVDVNTGERILINGYNKISFTPETALKDEINKPFSHFQTVILNDETSTEDMERVEEETSEEDDAPSLHDESEISRDSDVVQEINENLSEASVETEDNEDANSEVLDIQITDDSYLQTEKAEKTEDSPVDYVLDEAGGSDDEIQNMESTSSSYNDDKPEEKRNEDTVGVIEHLHSEYQHIECQNVSEGHIEHQRTHSQDVKDQKVEILNVEHQTVENQHIVQMIPEESLSKKNHISPIIVIILAMLVVLLMLASYFAGYYRVFESNGTPVVHNEIKVAESGDSLTSGTDTIKAEPILKEPEVRDSSLFVAKEKIDKPDSIIKAKPHEVSESKKKTENAVAADYPQVNGGKYEIIGTKMTHKLRSGESLRLISARIYGSKDYVDYIVVYNNIKNPDIVPVGMVLKLPELRIKGK